MVVLRDYVVVSIVDLGVRVLLHGLLGWYLGQALIGRLGAIHGAL